MWRPKKFGQIVHGRFALGVQTLLQRVDAINNLSPQLNGTLACGEGSELGVTTDRVAALTALKSVIQNERNRAVAGDADTEARNLGVVMNAIAIWWRL